MSSGLNLDASYVWSHMLDTYDTAGWGGAYAGAQHYQRAYDPGANYGAANFDVRNAFKAYAVYDLPVGRGRRFLNSNFAVDEVLGGWDVSPTAIWTSGSPFTLTTAVNNSYAQAGDQYPNQTGNPTPAHKSINESYNASALQPLPLAGTFGNNRRNNLYGPQYLLMNLALGKTFHVWENVNVEIRGSANNFINHPSFGLPNTTVGGGNLPNITSITVGGRRMQLYGRVSF